MPSSQHPVDKVATLNQLSSELKSQLQSARKHMSKAESALPQEQESRVDYDIEIETLNEALDIAAEKIHQLENNLAQERENNVSLVKKCDDLSIAHDDLRRQIKILKGYEQDSRQLKEHVTSLQQRLAEKELLVSELEDHINNVSKISSESSNEMQSSVLEMEKKLKDVEEEAGTRVREAQASASRSEALLQTLEERAQRAEKESVESKKQLNILQQENESRGKRFLQLQDEFKKTIRDWQDRAEKAEALVDTYQNDSMRVQEILNNAEEAQKTIEMLKGREDELMQTILGLENRAEKSEATVVRYEAETEKNRADAAQAYEKLEDILRDKENLEKQLHSTKHEYEKLQATVEELHKQMESKAATSGIHEQSAITGATVVPQPKEYIDTLEQRISILEEALEQYKMKCSRLAEVESRNKDLAFQIKMMTATQRTPHSANILSSTEEGNVKPIYTLPRFMGLVLSQRKYIVVAYATLLHIFVYYLSTRCLFGRAP